MSTVVTNLAKETMIAAISGDDWMIALLSGGSYDASYNNWSLVSGSEVPITGNYIQGGASLSGLNAYSLPDQAWFDGSSVTWTTVTLSATGAVIYRSTDGFLIEIIDFGAIQEAINGSFTLAWDSNHILNLVG